MLHPKPAASGAAAGPGQADPLARPERPPTGAGRGEPAVPPPPVPSRGYPIAVAAVPVRPALAPTVRLVGELRGSGFRDRQWLVERDGRFIQVTELLYRVAEQANGERTLEEIAAGVTASTDWIVTADQVRQLIQGKLMPLGLIAGPAGAGSGRRRRACPHATPSRGPVKPSRRHAHPTSMAPLNRLENGRF